MTDRKRLGERLVQAGLITEDHLQSALDFQKKHGGRLGDVLLQNGLIAEQALLRFLAAEYRTRYVSADKLSKVKIPSAILDKIPVKMAEQAEILPILWDDATRTLSLVMAEPQNLQLIEEVRLVSDAQQVAAYITSRSAVVAGVRKHYYGDINAFADLAASAQKVRDDVRALVDYYEHAKTGISELRVPTETNPNIGAATGLTGLGPMSARRVIDEVHSASLTSDNDFIETLNVMVGLLELPRGRFKGHSAAVAKLVRSLSRRMGLSEREMNHNIIASYLHDLGKKSSRHITLPKMAEDSAYREDAKKYYRTPSRLFEAVHLPVEVNNILSRVYEAWDGDGVPDGSRGTDIPLGSRMIAAVDAYEDLIRVPQGDGQEPMNRDLALATLTSYAGTLLDPQIVEMLHQILTGDLMRQKLLADGQHIVVVDPDPENASLLELKLTQKGYVVSIARDTQVALDLVRDGADLVISETALPGDDGFAFLATIRGETWGERVPLLFLTSDARSESVERGLEMGAVDYVVKPYAVEVFLAKVRRHLDTRAVAGAGGKTIRGSLDEMPFAEILRILCEASRSGKVHVKGHRKEGDVFLAGGKILHATFGPAVGAEAFTAISSIKAGEFTYDPEVTSLERTIDLDSNDLIGRAGQRQAR
jgi:response regulator RpfG family c-di-GMP phosphodiesterase